VLRTAEGALAQRSELTARHKEILRRLHLPEPPRFYQFTPADSQPGASQRQQDPP